MKSTATFCLAIFIALPLATQAQTWTFETLRSGIIGAWSRTADFDQDNDPDILVQSGDTIYWYENLRPGWTPHVLDPTFYNSKFAYVDVLDLDKDGDMDVIKVPSPGTGGDPLTWNENKSNGSEWINHNIQTTVGTIGWMPSSWGDLDGDGDIDLVIPEVDNVNTPELTNLYWLENMDNTGAWTKHPLKPGNHWYCSVADMDGDGDLDIAGSWEGLFWLENQLPEVTWTKHEVVAGTPNGHFIGECRDMNGDGKADIVSAPSETSGGIVYFANPGWDEVPVNITGQNLYIGAIGDIDGDGDSDVTYGGAGYLPQGLGWAENQNDGANWVLHDITPHDLIQRIPTGLADVDGDGDTDIVSLTFDVNSGLGSVFWASNPQISVDVTDPESGVGEVSLSVWPNPFSSLVTIQFELSENAEVHAGIYNLFGQKVHELVNNPLEAGKQTLTWDGLIGNAKCTSSVYLVQIQIAGQGRVTKKAVVR